MRHALLSVPIRPAGWFRAGIFLTWCLTLGLGVAVLEGLPVATLRPLGAGIAFWSWIFGASGCGRILALAVEGRWPGLPLVRMVCAVVGLVSWSQLSWLFLERVAASAASATVGAAIFAAVALAQLYAIYRAARDARIDDP